MTTEMIFLFLRCAIVSGDRVIVQGKQLVSAGTAMKEEDIKDEEIARKRLRVQRF